MLNKILTATDMLGACDAVVINALEIAKEHQAKLLILHVLESSSTLYRKFVKDFRSGEEIFASEDYHKAAKDELDEKCAGALKSYGNYEINVNTGLPYLEISAWARKERPDLIVLGAHAGRAEERGVVRTIGKIGSTVEGVIRHARCPVMIVNQLIPKEKLRFKRIMISCDFSKACETAAQFAIELAKKYGSDIFGFHMVPVPLLEKYLQTDLEKEIYTSKEKMKNLCEVTLGGKGISHECNVWEGTLPYVEILKFAREKEADLIVMGSHTREIHKTWYVGMTVEEVASRASCPVVIATHPKSVLKLES
jgi:nucleotide-binding universal stress UspA family protein